MVVPVVEEKEEEEEVSKDAKKEGVKDKAEEEEEDESKVSDPLVHILEPDEEDEMWEKVNERKINRTLPPRPGRGTTISEVRKHTKSFSCADIMG